MTKLNITNIRIKLNIKTNSDMWYNIDLTCRYFI